MFLSFFLPTKSEQPVFFLPYLQYIQFNIIITNMERNHPYVLVNLYGNAIGSVITAFQMNTSKVLDGIY